VSSVKIISEVRSLGTAAGNISAQVKLLQSISVYCFGLPINYAAF
jgi:hypothetical protein